MFSNFNLSRLLLVAGELRRRLEDLRQARALSVRDPHFAFFPLSHPASNQPEQLKTMASYTRPVPTTLVASSSKPTTSSSLRNTVHRKRSASSSDEDSSALIPSDDSPVVKKGRYEREELIGGILGKALAEANSQSAPSTPSSSSSRLPSKPVDTMSTPRSQFEQQEDFISFGFEEEPRSSRRPAKAAIPSSAGGRVLDQYESKQEEHSKRVQKREKGRTTPWCEDPGVNWNSCTSAIDMYVYSLSYCASRAILTSISG